MEQKNSLEALDRLLKYVEINEAILITKYGYSSLADIELIRQDLERLKRVESELLVSNYFARELIQQIEKLKKEIEEYKLLNNKLDEVLCDESVRNSKEQY